MSETWTWPRFGSKTDSTGQQQLIVSTGKLLQKNASKGQGLRVLEKAGRPQSWKRPRACKPWASGAVRISRGQGARETVPSGQCGGRLIRHRWPDGRCKHCEDRTVPRAWASVAALTLKMPHLSLQELCTITYKEFPSGLIMLLLETPWDSRPWRASVQLSPLGPMGKERKDALSVLASPRPAGESTLPRLDGRASC